MLTLSVAIHTPTLAACAWERTAVCKFTSAAATLIAPASLLSILTAVSVPSLNMKSHMFVLLVLFVYAALVEQSKGEMETRTLSYNPDTWRDDILSSCAKRRCPANDIFRSFKCCSLDDKTCCTDFNYWAITAVSLGGVLATVVTAGVVWLLVRRFCLAPSEEEEL